MSAESIVKSVHQRLLNIRDATGEQFNHLLADRLTAVGC